VLSKRTRLVPACFATLLIAFACFLPATFARQKPPAKAKPADGKAAVDFAKQVQPLFAAHCVKCHGANKQEGGLRLDHRRPALRGGDSGAILVPGKSGESAIIKRITSQDKSERMPPPDKANKSLTAEQIALIRKWVDEGAVWPSDGKRLAVKTDHWAYQPVKDVAPPQFTDAAAKQWIRNPIDAFVLAKLRAANLKPSPAADRYTLIRRLYYDLLGFPPAPRDVDAFVRDKSPVAYEKLVDRLLKSKHFGERWGRHWLDKARYADSDGYEKDNPRPDAWRYRDWVIDAVNRDLPFDQFTREQLAGDLLPPPPSPPSQGGAQGGWEQKLATAFHRQTLTNTEGGTDKEQFRVEAIFDRVATTGTVWLGLTVGCAQCHSHKYDPITQADYYQLFAFYNNGDETTTQIPTSKEAVAKYKQDKAAFDSKQQRLQTQLTALRKKLAGSIPAWESRIRAKLKATAKTAVRFHDFDVRSVKAKSGVKFQRQKDGSYLAPGVGPESDVYTLIAETTQMELTGIRLDVLADPKLPSRGPGRTPHGNFVLTSIRIEASATTDFKKRQAIRLTAATQDFAQGQFPAKNALQRNPRTGWAISPQLGRDHWAVFTTKKPMTFARPMFLRIVLEQRYGGKHTIGRFRLQTRTGTDPSMLVPPDVLAALNSPAENRNAKQRDLLAHHAALENAEYKKLDDQLVVLRKSEPMPPVMTVRVISQRTASPRTTHLLRRGDFLQPQTKVQPDIPAVLPELKPRRKTGTPDRLDLADWLVDPRNPLTPRVTVNHIWSHLFGTGLVATMDDFGVRGEKPSHPELLDWLANRFVGRIANPSVNGNAASRGADGLAIRPTVHTKPWSRKAMIRLIVTSATYRQSSRHRPELAERDPQNRLLARQNRFRVEAEIVRDIALEAAGLLSKKVGGPSVFPPMPPDVAALSYAGNFKWKTSPGEDRYRRGMYTFFKRTAPHPNLTTFDCPDSNTTAVQRRTSNTPLMALTTLNNAVFIEAAQALAKRVLTEQDLKTDEARLRSAIRLCISRQPTSKEVTAFHTLLESSRRWYAEHPKEAAQLAGNYQPKSTTPAETAAWVATCRMIMNVDEFLTRE
jgi:mono/diheme cytochrome c family protein